MPKIKVPRAQWDMFVNRDILATVMTHLAVPLYPDGACDCGDDECNHQADHLINELVKAFKLPWVRRYDQDQDGAWPPIWCEDADIIRKKFFPEEDDMGNEAVTEAVTDLDELLGGDAVDAAIPPVIFFIPLGGDDDEEDERESVSLYEARQIALDAALGMQKHVEEYTSAEALVGDAKIIYQWLTTDVEGA